MPNPFNQGDYEFMPPPPPKKKLPPKRQSAPATGFGLAFQINQHFDTEDEMNQYIEMNLSEHGTRKVEVINTWKKEVICCRVRLADKQK